MALLEVAREQREAHQQTEQVGQRHHFVSEMAGEAGQAKAGLESGEQDLVGADGDEAGQCDLQRVVVEERDAEQGQREQNEIDGNPGHCRQVGGPDRRGQTGKDERGKAGAGKSTSHRSLQTLKARS